MEEFEIQKEIEKISNHDLFEISNLLIVRKEYTINNNIPKDLTIANQGFLESKNAYTIIEDSNYNSIDDFIKSSSLNKAFCNEFRIYDINYDAILCIKDNGFDTFFAYKLKHTDLFQIDELLTYQLEKSFDFDFNEYKRFLTLLIRKYSKIILSEDIITTINEWLNINSVQYTQIEKISSNLNWTGDKVDFIKLMYALFHAKLLNKGEGKITQIVSEASQYFNVKYNPKGSDLSVSLFNADENGYDKSTFIKDIDSGFNTYLNTRNKD